MKPVTILGTVALAAVSYGTEMPDYCTDYLEFSDTDYAKSSLVYGENWRSDNVPGAGSTNYVGSGMVLRGPSSGTPSSGDVLALAGTYYAHKIAVNWNELRLLDNAVYSWGSQSDFKGRVVVEASEDSPASLKMFYGNGYCSPYLSATLVGASGTALNLARTSAGPAKVPSPDMVFLMRGDWSGFLGAVNVCTNTAIAFQSTSSDGNKCCGGRIVFERGSYLYGYYGFGFSSGVYTTLGSLDMRDGSKFIARVDGGGRSSCFVVTNELVFGDVDLLFYGDWHQYTNNVSCLPEFTNIDDGYNQFALFKLQGAAAEKVPDFSGIKLMDYPENRKLCGMFPAKKGMVCVENKDGSKTVYARYYDTFDWEMTNYTGQTYANSPLNPDNTGYWKNGEVPTASSTGLLHATKGFMWRGSNDSVGFDFPGLTSMHPVSTYIYCKYLNLSNLVVKSGVTVFVHQGPKIKSLRGRMTIVDGNDPVTICNYVGADFRLEAELLGDGSIVLKPDSNLNPSSTYRIYGTNVNFHGAISMGREFTVRVGGEVIGYYPDPEKGWISTVYLTDGRNLGGEYSKADPWKATAVGAWTKLKIEEGVENVTIDEPTRGMFITMGCAQFEPDAGQTFTVKQPVTFGGKLLKAGEGCLELGGEARFIDGDIATAPLEGTNILAVTAGMLKVLTTNAVNGVQMEFSGTGTLAVDADNASDGFAEYGFINTRWRTPFVPSAEGAAIPVKVCGVPEGGTASVAICTVSADVAEDLTLRVAKVPHSTTTLTRRANADGTVTFVASFKPTSLRIIVR